MAVWNNGVFLRGKAKFDDDRLEWLMNLIANSNPNYCTSMWPRMAINYTPRRPVAHCKSNSPAAYVGVVPTVCWANFVADEDAVAPDGPLGQLTLTSGSSVLLRWTSCCCTSRRLAKLPSIWWWCCCGGSGGGGRTTTTASAGVGVGVGMDEWEGAPGGITVAAAATAARVVAEFGECDTLYIRLPIFGCGCCCGGGGGDGISSSMVQTRSSTGKVKLISLPLSSEIPWTGVLPLAGLRLRPCPFVFGPFGAAGEVARVSVVVVVGELPLPSVVIVVASRFFSRHLLSPGESE